MKRKVQQTNRNFMYGTAVLTIAVILVATFFMGLAFDMKRNQISSSSTQDTYTLEFTYGFTAEGYQVYINDSLLYNGTLLSGTHIKLGRFAEDNALIIVNNSTDLMQIVAIPEKSGIFDIRCINGDVIIKKK